MLKEYLIGALISCLALALAVSLSHPKMSEVTRIGAGVLVICVVMLPFIDIIRSYDNDDLFSELLSKIESDSTDSNIELSFEEGIARYIESEYSLSAGCVGVSVDGFDLETLRCQRVYVTLSGEALKLDYKRLSEEISEMFTHSGECEVSLDI